MTAAINTYLLCGITFWVACFALFLLFVKWSIEDDPWDEWDQRSDRPYDLEDDVDTVVLINHHKTREVAALDSAFRYEQTDIPEGMRLRDWRGGAA